MDRPHRPQEVISMATYALLIYSPTDGGPSPEEMEAEFPRWMSYSQALSDEGVARGGEPLQDGATATTVRVRNGETIVTDGPFAETKELLGGFFLIDVPDLDAALAWAARMPNIEYGSVEVRPVMEIPAAAT
jgi:hypothetical protein